MIRHLLQRLLLVAGALLCFAPLAARAVPYYHYSYTGNPYPDYPETAPDYVGHFLTVDIFTFLPLQDKGLINYANTPALRLYMDDGINLLRWPDFSGPINNSISVSIYAGITVNELTPDGLPQSWYIITKKSFFETQTGHPLGWVEAFTGKCGHGCSSATDRSGLGDDDSGFGTENGGIFDHPGIWQLTITDAPLPAPEPSTYLLLGAGLLVLAMKSGLTKVRHSAAS